jgi:large subunit ribosomal protein L4
MRSMLSQKLREGNLVVVNHLHLDSHRTGPWAKILESKYGVGKALKKSKLRNNNPGAVAPTTSALILDHYLEPEDKNEESDHASYHGVPINLWVASSNIPRATVRNHRFLNVYDCLKNEKLIITLSALEAIEEKWKE